MKSPYTWLITDAEVSLMKYKDVSHFEAPLLQQMGTVSLCVNLLWKIELRRALSEFLGLNLRWRIDSPNVA